MNTVRSVWLGWGTLMVAGGAAYYFAKKDINAYRREQELKGTRGTEFLEWWQIVDRAEAAKQSAARAEGAMEDSPAEDVKPQRPKKKRTHNDKLG